MSEKGIHKLNLLLENEANKTRASIVRKVNTLLPTFYNDLRIEINAYHIRSKGSYDPAVIADKLEMRQSFRTIEDLIRVLYDNITEIYEEEIGGFYDRCYLITSKILGSNTNSLVASAMIGERKDAEIRSAWSGLDYEERLDEHFRNMRKSIKTHLFQSIMRKEGPAQNYNCLLSPIQYNIKRLQTLFGTEILAVMTYSQKKCYEDNRITKVKIINLANGGCHKIWGDYVATNVTNCHGEVGKVIDLSEDNRVGITLPPFHPHCACRIIHLEGEEH